MLKGVNRKIIEVRDPDSRYFERAILFVRQGDWAPKEIDEQAEQYLRAASEEMGRTRTAAPSATLLKERVGLRKLLFRAGAAGRAAAAGSGAGTGSEAVRYQTARHFQNLSNFDQTTCGSWICGGFCLERL